MKLNNKEIEMKLLENRINLLRTRGETENHGLIAKAERKLRRLKNASN